MAIRIPVEALTSKAEIKRLLDAPSWAGSKVLTIDGEDFATVISMITYQSLQNLLQAASQIPANFEDLNVIIHQIPQKGRH